MVAREEAEAQLLQRLQAGQALHAMSSRLQKEIHPEAVQRYLAMYGVTADRCEITGSNGRSTAESLLEQADKCNADLLVMGAYTRSRLRRLFFGAVTEEVLNNCPIPVFMAH